MTKLGILLLLLSWSLGVAATANSPTGDADALSQQTAQIQALIDADQLNQAQQAADDLARYADTHKLPQPALDAKLLQAKIASQREAYDSATQYLSEGLTLAQQAAMPRYIALFQLKRGVLAFEQTRAEEATQWLELAIPVLQANEDQENLQQAYRTLGMAYKQLAKFSKALTAFEHGRTLATTAANTTGAISFLNLQGSVYSDMGNSAKAIELFLQTYDLAIQANDLRNAIASKNNIGIVYNELKQYDKAIAHLNDALVSAKALGNQAYLAAVLNNIAENYLAKEDLTAALDFNQQSLAIEEAARNTPGISISKNNIADIKVKLGHTDQAIRLLNETMALEETLGDEQRKIEVLKSLAIAYLAEKNSTMAVAVSERCIAHSRQHELDKLLLGCLLVATDAQALAKDPEKALAYHKEYSSLQQRLLNEQTSNRVAELEVKYQTDSKQREIDLLKKESALKALQSASDRNTKIYLTVLLTLLMLLIVFILSRYRLSIKTAREIDEKNQALQAAYQKLEHIAKYDALTGVHSRRALQDLIDHEWVRAKRESRPISLLLLDIDHFKSVNDRFGHDVGDAVLIAVCSSITTTIREQDLFGRWGGEEFLLCLPETDADGARVVAESVRARIAATVLSSTETISLAQPLSVTASIGVAIVRPPSLSIDGAIKQADEALYRAKREGRNRVVFF